MARAAIRQLGQLFRIVGKALSMTIQTPPHVHDLRILVNLHRRQITMAILTVQACSNVRPVRKVDEIRHLGDRHPGDFLVV